jgi:hypothetical protein
VIGLGELRFLCVGVAEKLTSGKLLPMLKMRLVIEAATGTDLLSDPRSLSLLDACEGVVGRRERSRLRRARRCFIVPDARERSVNEPVNHQSRGS